MNHDDPTQMDEIARKIAILVREKGWNQERFANETGLNRQTARKILQPDEDFRLRNSTVQKCAQALNLKVHELDNLPVERLLLKMHQHQPLIEDDEKLQLFLSQVTQPELLTWIERNPDRRSQLAPDEWEELLEMQGSTGPLAKYGVEHFIRLIEQRRDLLQRVRAIANEGTYLEILEPIVDLIYEKIQPHSEAF